MSTKKVLGDACKIGPLREDLGDCDDDLYCQEDTTHYAGHCATPVSVGSRCEMFVNACDRVSWCVNNQCMCSQKILGHKSVQMTMRYAHLQPAAFRDDYGRFGPGVLGGGVVVPIAKSGSA